MLVTTFASRVTSLEGVTPRGLRCMSGLPPGIVSLKNSILEDFPRQNTEAPGYPSAKRLFAVRHRLSRNSLARAFAPFIVELFTVGLFVPSPELVIAPVRFVAKAKLPTPARLNEPFGPRIPWTGFSPALHRDGLAHAYKVCPRRPPSLVLPNRIERRDYSQQAALPYNGSGSQCEDYSDEPPSSTASHSHGTALYGFQHRANSEFRRTLSPVGCRVWRACRPIRETPTTRLT